MTRALLASVAIVAFAAAQPAVAQTVQLPSFHYFSAGTSVLVPDGGSVLLGGVNRASEGRVESGIPGLPGRPFTNVGIGSTQQAANVRVTAQIHDMEAMDQALLSVPVAGARTDPAAQFAATKSAAVPKQVPVESIVAVRIQAATESDAQQAEARDNYEHGLAAMRDGKLGAAKVYFQMAERRADGELKQLVQTQLRSLSDVGKSPQLAAQAQK